MLYILSTLATDAYFKAFYVTRLEGEEGWQHTDELIVCDDDNLPSTHASKRFSSTRVLCKIETDLRAVPARCWKTCTNSDGGRYQSLTFVLGMQMDSGSLLFDMRVNNVEYGSVTATFN